MKKNVSEASDNHQIIYGEPLIAQTLALLHFAKSKEFSHRLATQLTQLVSSKSFELPLDLDTILHNSPEFYCICHQFFPRQTFRSIPYNQKIYDCLKQSFDALVLLIRYINSQFYFNRIRDIIAKGIYKEELQELYEQRDNIKKDLKNKDLIEEMKAMSIENCDSKIPYTKIKNPDRKKLIATFKKIANQLPKKRKISLCFFR